MPQENANVLNALVASTSTLTPQPGHLKVLEKGIEVAFNQVTTRNFQRHFTDLEKVVCECHTVPSPKAANFVRNITTTISGMSRGFT